MDTKAKVAAGSVVGFVVLIIWVFATAASEGKKIGNVPTQTETPATSVSQKVGVGEEGYVKSSANKTVIATSEASFEALVKASVANDTMGIAQLMLDGRAFGVENGTKVLIIDRTTGARQVRVLEGEHVGETGWLAMEFVVKKK